MASFALGICGPGSCTTKPRQAEHRFIVATIIQVQIEFDPDKREQTLKARGLDFAQAGEIFAGQHVSQPDTRADYGEERHITVGTLQGRLVVVVWTQRGAPHHQHEESQ